MRLPLKTGFEAREPRAAHVFHLHWSLVCTARRFKPPARFCVRDRQQQARQSAAERVNYRISPPVVLRSVASTRSPVSDWNPSLTVEPAGPGTMVLGICIRHHFHQSTTASAQAQLTAHRLQRHCSNLSVVRESPYTFLPPTVTRVSPMLMGGTA